MYIHIYVYMYVLKFILSNKLGFFINSSFSCVLFITMTPPNVSQQPKAANGLQRVPDRWCLSAMYGGTALTLMNKAFFNRYHLSPKKKKNKQHSFLWSGCLIWAAASF